MLKARALSWRPHTTFILIGGFVVVLIALFVSYVVTNFKPTTEVRLGSGVYHLWLADSEAERVQGLSGVERLKPDGGLLMAFEMDGKWGIWMKDMLVPLDIVWLDNAKQVVYIVKNATPEMSTDKVMMPKDNARYVLEFPAGTVDQADIRTGQDAQFEFNSVDANKEGNK